MSKADTPLTERVINAIESLECASVRLREGVEGKGQYLGSADACDRDVSVLRSLQSTLDRLSEPGEGCRGCGGIIGPYCVECGEAAGQQQAGSPKKKSEE